MTQPHMPDAPPAPEEVFRIYRNSVFRLAYSITANRDDADDILQDVFLLYLRKRPRCKNEEHRKTWLLRVTLNCSRSRVRSVWNQTVPLPETLAEAGPDLPEDSVLTAVRQLPPLYRAVIHLFYYEDRSTEQIASLLRKNPSTVRSLLSRGREYLRNCLKGEDF